MELTKTNGFCEMNEMEMQEVDGGVGFVEGMLIGFVVDGIIIVTTGKSAGEWCAEGIKAVGDLFKPEVFY